jgi:hypothetical protein
MITWQIIFAQVESIALMKECQLGAFFTIVRVYVHVKESFRATRCVNVRIIKKNHQKEYHNKLSYYSG